jgi:3-hydroxyisobutyrate dehydrogenase-like beta-hydroxyacid dehydrogenase
VNLERFLEVVRSSSGNSYAAELEHLLTWRHLVRDNVQNTIGTIHKDLHLALDLSNSLGLNLTHLEAMVQQDVRELVENVASEVVPAIEQ